ncbi:MAG: alpha/beta hydrolase [Planctomycetaceae bacterium]
MGHQRFVLSSRIPVLFRLCGALVLAGCNMPDAPILTEPRIGIHYDTSYEKMASSGRTLPLLEGVWEPYYETLAEPVCVQSWKDSHSTWEILFATNRGRARSQATGHYGNDVLTRPDFGVSSVQLPHRKRGKEPARNPGKLSFASLIRKDAKREEHLAVVERAESISSSEFDRKLHEQIARSRQKDVLLFVHGFNVDFDSSLIRTAQLGLDIPFNGALVAYSWPTQGGVLNYEGDESINEASVAPFTEFLSRMIERLPEDARLKIIVHSMGNRIVLKGVSQLAAANRSSGRRKPIQTLCLCAPDVGVSDYRDLIPAVNQCCDRVVLYANGGDGALKISRSLHLEQRSGDAEVPAAISGVDLIDCSAVDFSFLGHSYFSGNVSVLADLFCVLKENKSPSQCPHLKQKQTSSGDEYWVFDQHPHRVLWSWHFEDPAEDPFKDQAE